MCDDSTTVYNPSYYLEDTDSTTIDASLAWAICETIANKPRRPRFSYKTWIFQKTINFKLMIQHQYEKELQQGIKLQFRLLRFKDGFV